jgi:diguanylate cyclase (GGDEF)-like protein
MLLCSALLFLIGFLDYITGEEISFSAFYLLPVSFATWRTSKWIGILFSVFSAIVWFYADMLTGHVYSHTFIPYWNTFVRLCFFLIVSILLTNLKKSFMHEKELSRKDQLTGLLNMRAFYDLAYVEVNRARRFKRPFTVAYIDVDNFKMVNDQFGHEAGNILLQVIAKTLKTNIRAVDLCARLGGDEFVILLGETASESAHVVFSKLQEQIIDAFDRNRWPVTLSIGAVTYNKPPDTIDDILKKADSLMYSAKNSGKNKITYELVD